MKAFIPIFMFSGMAILVAVTWYIKTYNRFIKYRNSIEAAWSSIDVALKRRFNLIPNLIEAVKEYEDHEAEILSESSLKSLATSKVPRRMAAESQVSGSLNNLMALAEAYPDLKASRNFLSLQHQLNEVEKDIQTYRNHFNQAVRKYNTAIESIPNSWIARKYGFVRGEYFTLELATQREFPEMAFEKPTRNESEGERPMDDLV